MTSWNKGQFGTPDAPGQNQGMRWIAEHLDCEKDACLLWPFSRDRAGYGVCWYKGKVIRAHRFICKWVKGPPPTAKHHAAHSCGNGHEGCVNPHHLSWKTAAANSKESASHPRFKLTPDQVRDIRALQGRERTDVIAARYGVRESTIRAIFKRRNWKGDGYSYGGFAHQRTAP